MEFWSAAPPEILPGDAAAPMHLHASGPERAAPNYCTAIFIATVAVVVPDVPVTVTAAFPVVAVLLAVKLRTLLVVLLVGLKVAVTPLGKPEIVNVTVPVKPPEGVTLIVLVPAAPPRVSETEAGVAESVKLPPPVDPGTVSVTVVVFVRLPDVPVTVMGNVPDAADAPTINAKRLEVVELVGANVAVTPVGRPEAENATLPVNPPVGVTVTTLLPLAPLAIVMLLGAAESVKFAELVPVTVRLTVVDAVSEPEVPVTVTVVVPVAAVALATNVSALVVVAVAGLKFAVTPDGKPVADSTTLPLNPFFGVIVTVTTPDVAPCATLMLPGAALSEKLGDVETGHAFTRFAAFTVPTPVVKSHPVVAGYAG